MWIEACCEVMRADPVVTPLLLLGMVGGMASQMHAGAQAKKQARKNAQRLEMQRMQELSLQRRRARFGLGRLRSNILAGGVSLGSPTSMDVLASTAAYEEEVAQRASDPYRWEAERQLQAGDIAMSTSMVGAGQTMLSGVSQIATRYPTEDV